MLEPDSGIDVVGDAATGARAIALGRAFRSLHKGRKLYFAGPLSAISLHKGHIGFEHALHLVEPCGGRSHACP
mgnify:CR=1 FL=1